MSYLRKYILYLCLLSFSILNLQAQNVNIDSLLNLLKTAKEDTVKVSLLNDIAWELKYDNLDSSILLSDEALSAAEKLKWNRGIAISCHNRGNIHNLLNNNSEALIFYLKGLKLFEEIHDKKGISTALGNIGIIYDNMSDYTKALDYFLKSLKVDEEIGNKKGIARNLSNIGGIYYDQKDYSKALDYFLRSMKISEELGDKNIMAKRINNIANVYKDQENYTKALDYFLKALKIDEELGDRKGMAVRLGNIGILYDNRGEASSEQKVKEEYYLKADEYYAKALKVSEEIGDKYLIASMLINMGSLYINTGKYAESEKCLLGAGKIFNELGALNEEEQYEEAISDLYELTGKYQLSLEHYKKARILKDSIFNEEKNKELTRKEMNYDFEKKTAAARADQEKKDAVTTIIICSVTTGFALVLLLAGFIFRSYRQKQKANIIITQQKHLVEEKQKEIIDSINYARRIQRAHLPNEKYISKKLSELKFN